MAKEVRKILFRTINIILVFAVVLVGILTVRNNEILKLSSKEDEKKALTTISKFKKISANRAYSMAIDSIGNLWTWGSGYLGNGNSTTSIEPIKIKSGTTFTQIAAGYNHSMAIDSERKLMGMGR